MTPRFFSGRRSLASEKCTARACAGFSSVLFRTSVCAIKTGRASFLVSCAARCGPFRRPNAFSLITMRSHDNTTHYSLTDLYHGLAGPRDMTFMPPRELAKRRLQAGGDRVDIFLIAHRSRFARRTRVYKCQNGIRHFHRARLSGECSGHENSYRFFAMLRQTSRNSVLNCGRGVS